MKTRIEDIKKRIKEAAVSCGRNPEKIQLVAASKTIPANKVKEVLDAGITILGENYIQEAREKITTLSSYHVSWHFIGKLQTNKAKYAVKLFDLIHSVDTLKLARELNKQAGKIEKIQNILIQVNISKESTKSGIFIEETMALITAISKLTHLSVSGLMTMPPFFNDPEKVRPYFSALRNLRESLHKKKIPHVSMNHLSMGMSGDFEVAIQEGATLIRIGTAIFGKRK